jgi:hypothetical protein
MTLIVFGLATAPARGSIITWSDKAVSGFDADETAVVEAAIGRWESLITDFGPLSGLRTTFTVSITEAATAGIGVASGFTADVPGIPLSGTIVIDDGTFAAAMGGFFVDLSPDSSTEYVPSAYTHYGTAVSGGPADGTIDLLTVVLHELGHVLGFTDSYTLWALRISPPDTLDYDLIPPTASATLFDADHLKHSLSAQPFDLMAAAADLPTLGVGDRRLPSALDLDILSGIYFDTVDATSLESISSATPVVPEPSAISLVGIGIALLVSRYLPAIGRRIQGVSVEPRYCPFDPPSFCSSDP